MISGRKSGAFFRKLLPLLCLFLAAYIGTVQVVHVHSASSKLPSHDCSVCSAAHSGAIATVAYHAAPVLFHGRLVVVSDVSSGCMTPESSLYIRPPPSV